MADAGSFNADLGVNLQFNVDGAGLVEMSRTIKEISKGKDLQRYWKDVETATDNAGKAIERYSRNVNSQGLAESFLKQINALKAITQKENLSELFPNMDINFDELIESAKKVAPRISSEFSVSNFEQAFKTFDLLRDKGIELGEVFSQLADYVNVVKRNSELGRENSEFRNLLGDADIEKLKKDLGELQKLRSQAEREFESFLNINKIERKDFWGDEKFSEYFTEIRNGSMTATDAIARFKTEYGYLLEESFKTNNDTFGLEQLQAFSNKLDSIFRQVEETSTKINDIISNGVITKSVENLSMDSSLSDSQRSLFGNLLQDEESLKSITALFQKLIEESNKTSKVNLFNDEQLQQVLSIFDKMEGHLSSLRSIISDIGDGEEFSPLLKMINNVQSSISELSTSVKGIGLNMNIDVGSDDELDRKLQTKVANALQAYQKLFNNIKMSSAGGSLINQDFFDFNLDNYDTAYQKLQAIVNFIKKQRVEAKKQFNGYDALYEDSDKSLWKSAQAYLAQVTKAETEIKKANSGESNPLENLFGNTKDLSEVIEQLNKVVEKLNEISSSATEFKNIFKEGFNVTASVEEIDKLTNRVKELEDELSKIKLNPVNVDKSNISSPKKDVFQGSTSSAEKLEEEIRNVDSATEKASESAKEYRKILSQVGEFDIDSKVSAMYKRNDGQLESWTWRAKKDDEGNVLYDQDGNIDYDEPTVTVISKYEQLEKIIVKADNELRNLQKDLAEVKAYDPTASTTNIEAKISDQKEYIRLLEQTVKVISQSDEYLLDEQQIIDARNKAAREYALTTGAKQEKTDAKQSASDEKKRLANIEQVNRALNRQQIAIDAIEKTYNKTTNPDLDREVSNQQDLAELAQKKLAIQTKINSLQGKERNSANEKEFLELEKLIAEYKELAKYKLKANNPSKQELGGQNLQTLIQVQISNYDKLITKAEKYGDATSDTIEKLKEQRDILSKIGSDGKYSATADQYYASRDTYKVESAALSAFEAETKVAEQEAKAIQKLAEEKRKLRQQEKQSTQSSVDKALKDQVSAWKQIQSIREKIAKTDNADEINALQESKKYYQEQYNNANKILKANDDLYNKESQIAKLEQVRLETNAKIAGYKKDTSLSSMESSLKSYQDKVFDLSIKPDDAHRFPEYQAQLDSINKAINDYETHINSLQNKGVIDQSDIDEANRLKSIIEELFKNTKKFSSGDKGFTNIGADKVLEKINSILEQNSRMSKTAKDKIKAYYNEIYSGNPTRPLNEILDSVYKIVQQEREAGRAGKSWLDIFKDKKIYSFIGQAASMFSFYDLINLGRQSFETIRELDTALVDLKKTTAMNSSQLEEFYFDSNDVAKQMGVTTQAIIEQASAWSRLGYSTKDSSTQMAELSSQFAAISPDMDLDTATDGLVSSMKAFDIEVSNVERDIMDNINRIGNTAATSNGEIVDMLTRSSAAMAAANNTIQETIALETAAVEITRNAETTGTAFKTLSMRIRGRQTLPPYTVMYMLCA